MLEDRLDLGPEEKGAVAEVVVERLDAIAIARSEQSIVALVPDGEGEHPVEATHASRAPFLIGLEHHFRVGLRMEAVPARLELDAEIREVVDLAVIGDDERAV